MGGCGAEDRPATRARSSIVSAERVNHRVLGKHIIGNPVEIEIHVRKRYDMHAVGASAGPQVDRVPGDAWTEMASR